MSESLKDIPPTDTQCSNLYGANFQDEKVTIPDCQLLIVTGKGGVGKTSVATALARQSANEGKRTLLTVYEREDVEHSLLGEPVSYGLNQVDKNLWVSRLDARLSMKEYVHRTIPFHKLYDWIMDGKVLSQFTDAAPGFDELMCLGKLYDLSEGSNGKISFDRIIFDAPATGHSALMLRTPGVTSDAVRTGPLYKSAQLVHGMLADKQRCCVLVVALPEEMAILEGTELQRYVAEDLDFNVGPLIINKLRPQRFSDAEIERLEAETLSPEIQPVIDNAVSHYQLASLQQSYLAKLQESTNQILISPQIIQSEFNSRELVDEMAQNLTSAFKGGK